MLIFSFRARAGRLSFVDLFFPYIDVASHVFVPCKRDPSNLRMRGGDRAKDIKIIRSKVNDCLGKGYPCIGESLLETRLEGSLW